MGIINSGIQSIAEEKASTTSKIERIHSEVTESVADELVMSASVAVYKESVDEMDDTELEALLKELPEDADLEKEEIARILAVEDDDIDLGVPEDVTMLNL